MPAQTPARITLVYKHFKTKDEKRGFACGLAVDAGDVRYLVAFPTVGLSYQQAALAALRYALLTLSPLPRGVVVHTAIKYLADLFERKEDGTYVVNPKANLDAIASMRSSAPGLQVEDPDGSIVEACLAVAMDAAEKMALVWRGFKPQCSPTTA